MSLFSSEQSVGECCAGELFPDSIALSRFEHVSSAYLVKGPKGEVNRAPGPTLVILRKIRNISKGLRQLSLNMTHLSYQSKLSANSSNLQTLQVNKFRGLHENYFQMR